MYFFLLFVSLHREGKNDSCSHWKTSVSEPSPAHEGGDRSQVHGVQEESVMPPTPEPPFPQDTKTCSEFTILLVGKTAGWLGHLK